MRALRTLPSPTMKASSHKRVAMEAGTCERIDYSYKLETPEGVIVWSDCRYIVWDDDKYIVFEGED